MNEESKLAEHVAWSAHQGQFRRDGVTPYINHPASVAKKCFLLSDQTQALAWLHDVLEDSDNTPDALIAVGISKETVDKVVRLTRHADVPYEDYLQAIKSDPICIKVKIADMLCNLEDAPTEKQVKKYAHGLAVLLGYD